MGIPIWTTPTRERIQMIKRMMPTTMRPSKATHSIVPHIFFFFLVARLFFPVVTEWRFGSWMLENRYWVVLVVKNGMGVGVGC